MSYDPRHVALARAAAEAAYDHHFKQHRGAMERGGATFLFGNDGYRQDETTRIQVEVLRQLLDEMGVKELAFATDDREDGEDGDVGYTWAMLVNEPLPDRVDVHDLHETVWEAWRVAGLRRNPDGRSFEQVQRGGVIVDD